MTYPRSWRKLLFKMPILWWRLGFGSILGRFFLVLTTIGRKSGLPRHTALEYSVMNGRKYVSSGWGEKTQWYKNILADPRVTIQTGYRLEEAIARPVTDDVEIANVYHCAKGKSPVWAEYLTFLDIRDNAEDFVAKKDRLYILRLDPTDEPTPPGLKADLIWVWMVVLVGGLAAYFLARSSIPAVH